MSISARRLANQGISDPRFTSPQDVVSWLGAMQAQDYAAAKWAIGLRLRVATDDDVERAFAEGHILRTHVLRPTWHFVTPADLSWLLALTAPHVHSVNAHMYRTLGLDEALFKRSNEALEQALRGGRQLTRTELREVLQTAGIKVDDGLRLGYLVMYAELEAVICSGPRRGKQFTYALLDERVPLARIPEREVALAELARRFFTSRGPATVHDFAWWSGLTVADARQGLEAVEGDFEREVVGTKTIWFRASLPPAPDWSPRAHLLSVYDEYLIGYHDRSDVVGSQVSAALKALGPALQYTVVVDGQVVGTWKRTFRRDAVLVHVNLLTALTNEQRQAVDAAARRYGDFYGLPVAIA